MTALALEIEDKILTGISHGGLKVLLSLAHEDMNALRIDLDDIERATLGVTAELEKLHIDDVSADREHNPARQRFRSLRTTYLRLTAAEGTAQQKLAVIDAQTQKLERLINRPAGS